jgi:integrase
MAKRGSQEGSIFKRANGKWGAALQVDGKRRYVYAATRKEVQEKLHVLQREAQTGAFSSLSRQGIAHGITVRAFLEQWVTLVAQTNVRPRTWDHYDLCVRRMIPLIGRVKLVALTANNIRAMEVALSTSRKLSARTVRHCHAVLHNALNEAARQGVIARNPSGDVTAPRIVRKELHTLSRHQVKQLLAISKGTRWHALWALLIATGMRLGEATALRWQDIDLTRGVATIQRSLQRHRTIGLVFAEPKTAGSRRAVQLPKGVVANLREHRIIVERMKADTGDSWKDCELVFPAQSGGPIDPGRVNTALHNDLHKSGLPRLRVHDLRHSTATLLLEEDTHPKIVQDLLGHSTIAMTLDLYSHVTPRLQDEATAKLQQMLFDTGPDTPANKKNRRCRTDSQP